MQELLGHKSVKTTQFYTARAWGSVPAFTARQTVCCSDKAMEARRREEQAAAVAAVEARRAELAAAMEKKRAEFLAKIEARKRACAAGDKTQCGS